MSSDSGRRESGIEIGSPDGFPFAARLPVRVDGSERLIRIEADPLGVPLQPGLACLTAHAHSPQFTWQSNFQVRGDLERREEGWALIPHKLLPGFGFPHSRLAMIGTTARRMRRFRRNAKRELQRRR